MNVIGQYGHATGQQINFDKSSVVFGHKVQQSRKEELKQICGISKIGGMGTYLGLPESLGGSKSKIFAYVRDRLDGKINGWSAKFLSKGGKEVLIKSVATAIPTYVMTCFRLPNTVTTKLTGAISKFWWSSGNHKRGMHWLSWSKLCKSKSHGGLGFKAIEDFNTALLAKQLWRLMEYPDSLFAKIFKGRYFRNTTPMERIRNYSSSYGWRSIISARSLVEKGLIKRIGSGQSTFVWKDPWIPASTPRPAKGVGASVQQDLTVDKLIDQTTKTWNLDLLRTIMDPSDIMLVCGLTLSQNQTEDKQGWHFTKSGRYTVKSGYHVEYEEKTKNTDFQHYGPNIYPLQEKAWKLKCPKKIQHFVWQALSGAIPVSTNLNYRGILCDVRCSRCGADRETTNHVLFECPPSIRTWALSDIPSAIEVFPTKSVFSNLDYLFSLSNQDGTSQFPWILWYLWKSRNEKIFNNLDRSPEDILKLALLEAQTWKAAQVIPDKDDSHTSEHRETQQRKAEFMCLIDGSWKESDVFSGQGWFCTRTREEGCLMGARNTRRSLTPLHAEFEALLWAIANMIAQGWKSVEFATDCSDLLKITTFPQDWPAFSIYLEDLGRLKTFFSVFSLSLIPRRCNAKADSLAKSARKLSFHTEHVNVVPPSWLSEPL